MLRIVICSLSLLALLAACDRTSSVQKSESKQTQKLVQNDNNDQLIIDNDVDEPNGEAIDKAEHDEEVEVDMD